MSALTDGDLSHFFDDGGATYVLVMKYRHNFKDYRSEQRWRHGRSAEFGTAPAMHHRDSMKWNAAHEIDVLIERDRRDAMGAQAA